MAEEKEQNEKKGGKKKKFKHDPEYIAYCEHGDSSAVFIFRDIVNKVNVSGYWIDILDFEELPVPLELEKKEEDYKKVHNFAYFVSELFPRYMNPDYSKCKSEEERRYETWVTARKDIENQRKNGYEGKKFLVIPKLFKEIVLEEENKERYNYRILYVAEINNFQVSKIKYGFGKEILKARSSKKHMKKFIKDNLFS